MTLIYKKAKQKFKKSLKKYEIEIEKPHQIK